MLELTNPVHCYLCKALIIESDIIKDDMAEINNGMVMKVYRYANRLVMHHGYEDQINWLEDLLKEQPYKSIGWQQFFTEYTWVVFTCGFRADIVRKYWEDIRTALRDFDIRQVREMNFETLLENMPIKNKQKIRAIIKTSHMIDEEWFKSLRSSKSWQEVRDVLIKLPFIGNVTVWHIMRNLGVDCFKPDRHIENLASLLKMDSGMVFQIITGETETYIGVADYILWRACATLGSASSLVEHALKEKDIPSIDDDGNKNITDYLF